jgi:hypothetical protein
MRFAKGERDFSSEVFEKRIWPLRASKSIAETASVFGLLASSIAKAVHSSDTCNQAVSTVIINSTMIYCSLFFIVKTSLMHYSKSPVILKGDTSKIITYRFTVSNKANF